MNSKILIFGGADGIGRAIADELVTKGGQVHITSRSAEKIRQTPYEGSICDVLDVDQIAAAETFEDAIDAAAALYELNKAEEKQDQKAPEEAPEAQNDQNSENDEGGEDGEEQEDTQEEQEGENSDIGITPLFLSRTTDEDKQHWRSNLQNYE